MEHQDLILTQLALWNSERAKLISFLETACGIGERLWMRMNQRSSQDTEEFGVLRLFSPLVIERLLASQLGQIEVLIKAANASHQKLAAISQRLSELLCTSQFPRHEHFSREFTDAIQSQRKALDEITLFILNTHEGDRSSTIDTLVANLKQGPQFTRDLMEYFKARDYLYSNS